MGIFRTLERGNVAKRLGAMSTVAAVIAAGVLSLGVAQAGAVPNNLSGTVLESDGSTPAANTNVQVQQQNSPNQSFTTTDPSGNYGFFVGDGTWVITAQPPSGDTTDAATSITVTVSGGSIISGPNPPDITLQVANVSGTVFESDGTTPAQNSGIFVQQQGQFNQTFGSTDSSGNYNLFVGDGTWIVTANPPPGDSTDVSTSITVVVAGGHITSIDGVPSTGPADITLQTPNVSGTVFESDGTTPAANANINVQQQNSPNGSGTQTDSSGIYGVHVGDGIWVITAQPPNGDTTDAPTSITITVSGGHITSGPNPPDITLQTANVSGTVVESDGTTPAANTFVQLQQQNSPNGFGTGTDSSGHYGVHLGDGTWVITAYVPSGDTTDAPTSITITVLGGHITSGPNPPDITLQVANLSGTVFESDGTTPAANSNVNVQQQNVPNGTGTQTDSSGHYGVHVGDGIWVITAQPPNGDTTDAPTSITITVSGGHITSGPNPPDITLQTANVSGTVVESDGTTPAANTFVQVQQQGSPNSTNTNTDSIGHYGVHVGDGTWVITAQPPFSDTDDAPTSITITVSGGHITSGPNPPNIRLNEANLSGTVFESDHTIAQNTFVSAQLQGSFGQTFANTGQSGHYGMFVADGTWIVSAQPPSGDTTDAPTSITVVVAGGHITSINGSPSSGPADINFQTANLTGTVVRSDGTTPAQNSFVGVFNQSTNTAQGNTNTDSSGHYGLHVPDGTWVVSAQPPSGDTTDAPTSITVVVAGGAHHHDRRHPQLGTGRHQVAGGQPERHGVRVRRHHPGPELQRGALRSEHAHPARQHQHRLERPLRLPCPRRNLDRQRPAPLERYHRRTHLHHRGGRGRGHHHDRRQPQLGAGQHHLAGGQRVGHGLRVRRHHPGPEHPGGGLLERLARGSHQH